MRIRIVFILAIILWVIMFFAGAYFAGTVVDPFHRVIIFCGTIAGIVIVGIVLPKFATGTREGDAKLLDRYRIK